MAFYDSSASSNSFFYYNPYPEPSFPAFYDSSASSNSFFYYNPYPEPSFPAFYDSSASSNSFYYNPYPEPSFPYHQSSYSYSYTPYSSGIEILDPSSYTNFTIFKSVSSSEFNEPDFKEYDPTPYSGGYDQAATYGSPLPPSDAICYPRTLPKPDSKSPEVLDTTPVPYSKDDDLGIKVKPREEQETVELESGGDYYFEKAYGKAGYFYGSGMESVDLCDGLFGYWPCWAKREKEEQEWWTKGNEVENRGRRRKEPHPWEELCADYFFGTGVMNNNTYDGYAEHTHQS